MGMFKSGNSGSGSMWTPQAKGNTSKIWSSFSGEKGNSKSTGSFAKKNPGMNDQRNSKKSGGCAFC